MEWHWPKVTRDGVLFVFGLGGIVHEAWIRSGETRPEFLMLFAAMCGLPFALRHDEQKGGSDERPDSPRRNAPPPVDADATDGAT